MKKTAAHVHKEGRVVTLTIDRPPLNILDIATIEEMHDKIERATRDRAAEVLVIRAAGEKAFSAGVEVREHTPEKVPAMLGAFHGLIRLLLHADPVTIAVVHAPALGGGAELALACDLVAAAAGTHFSFPEIQLGCYPPVALATLPLRIGPQRAAELVLLGRDVPAEEALGMGLVNRIAPRGDLDAVVGEIVRSLSEKSPEVLRLTVRLLRRSTAEEATRRIQEAEEAYISELLASDDMKEGIQAFLEKRKPVWRRPEGP